MDAGIAHDEALLPIATLPVQFRDMWHGSRPSTPEQLLALTVLGEAVNDLRSYRFARRRRHQRLYAEAYRWVASDDRSWPYAFANLCDALHLSVTSLRGELLSDVPTGAQLRFRVGARSSSRAASNRDGGKVLRLSRAANVKRKMARPVPASRQRAAS